MAPKSRDGRARLGEPLATELAALRIALGGGTTEVGVLRDAVRAYIRARMKDKKLRVQYEAELAKLMVAKSQPIRLVKSDSEPIG